MKLPAALLPHPCYCNRCTLVPVEVSSYIFFLCFLKYLCYWISFSCPAFSVSFSLPHSFWPPSFPSFSYSSTSFPFTLSSLYYACNFLHQLVLFWPYTHFLLVWSFSFPIIVLILERIAEYLFLHALNFHIYISV